MSEISVKQRNYAYPGSSQRHERNSHLRLFVSRMGRLHIGSVSGANCRLRREKRRPENIDYT